MNYLNRISIPFGFINIYAKNPDFLCVDVLSDGSYRTKISNFEFNVYFGESNFISDQTYRAKQFRDNGLYLGHHIGKKALLKIKNNNMYIYIFDGAKSDYQKVFWSFVIKYVLTYYSLKTNSLHFKGVFIMNVDSKEGTIILGKGGDGKTTLSHEMKKFGYTCLTNTHLIINNDIGYGLNSWVRIRKKHCEEYVLENKNSYLDCKIKNVFIYHYNENGMYIIKDINREMIYSFIEYFANALINYDMKEEVFDYIGQNFNDSIGLLTNNELKIQKFINSFNIKFLSVDVKDKNSLLQFINSLS